MPTVRFLDPDGRSIRTIEIDREPEESSPAELDLFADSIRQMMGRSGMPTEMVREAVGEFRERWRIKPKYVNARYDRGTDLVVIHEQNPEDLGSGPARIHLLTGGGVFLGSVPFLGPWVDFDLQNGRLFVLTRDPDTDLAVLSGYTVVIPENALEYARGLIG